jgi:hypothetical protein
MGLKVEESLPTDEPSQQFDVALGHVVKVIGVVTEA